MTPILIALVIVFAAIGLRNTLRFDHPLRCVAPSYAKDELAELRTSAGGNLPRYITWLWNLRDAAYETAHPPVTRWPWPIQRHAPPRLITFKRREV